jgi:hypothetical protein
MIRARINDESWVKPGPGWSLRGAALVVGAVFLAGCSASSVSRPPVTSRSSTSAQLPSRAVAARIRPCGKQPQKRFSAIVGKPVYLDHVGNIGQSPILSDGAVLPKIWVATCNVNIRAYPTTALYVQVELTPGSAEARLEFTAVRTRMGLSGSVVTAAGYGEAAVFDLDQHGDATVLVLEGPEVFTVEVTATSKPAPSPASRLKIAKAIAELIVAENT